MKTRILQEFKNSEITIISEENLVRYIDYCLEHSTIKTKNKTSYHHVLPKSLFKEFSNLKDFAWNGVHLSFYNHYYAHWLLTESISSSEMLFAFCAMHNQDIANGRIQEKDLIPKETFDALNARKSREFSELMTKEYLNENGEVTSIAKENGKKTSKKLTKPFLKDGKMTSIAKEKGKNLSKKVNKEYLNENGKVTSIAKENGKKISKKLTKPFLKDGSWTSIAKERGSLISYTLSKQFTEGGMKTSIASKSNIKAHKETRNKLFILNGEETSINKESSKKRLKTLSKEYINDKGIKTNGFKENGKKISATKNKEFLKNGELTSSSKEGGKKLSDFMRNKYWKYDVYKNENKILQNIPRAIIYKLAQSLLKTDHTIGIKGNSSSIFKKKNKEYLIGCSSKFSPNQDIINNISLENCIEILNKNIVK